MATVTNAQLAKVALVPGVAESLSHAAGVPGVIQTKVQHMIETRNAMYTFGGVTAALAAKITVDFVPLGSDIGFPTMALIIAGCLTAVGVYDLYNKAIDLRNTAAGIAAAAVPAVFDDEDV